LFQLGTKFGKVDLRWNNVENEIVWIKWKNKKLKKKCMKDFEWWYDMMWLKFLFLLIDKKSKIITLVLCLKIIEKNMICLFCVF